MSTPCFNILDLDKSRHPPIRRDNTSFNAMKPPASLFSARRIALSVLVGLALLLPLTASATNRMWNFNSTGSQNWSLTTNWDSGVPNGSSFIAIIGSTYIGATANNLLNNTTYAVNQDIGAGITLGGLSIDLRSIQVSPTDIGATLTGSNTLTLSSVAELAVGTELYSSGGFISTGTTITAISGNVVTLSSPTLKPSAGGNTFIAGAGNTTVSLSGSPITFGAAAQSLTVSGVLSTSSVTINNNLVFAGGTTTTFNTTNSPILNFPTLTGVLSGSGNVTVNLTYQLNNTSGTASSQSGAWTVWYATMTLGNSNSSGSASYALNTAGQIKFANASNDTYSNLFTVTGGATGAVIFSGVGGVTNTLTNMGDLAGTGSFSFLTSGGTGNTDYKVTTPNWSPTIALTVTGSTLELASASGIQALSGNITGTGALVRSTAGGTSVLSGTNTYSGGTTVTGGTLVTTKAAALPFYSTPGKVVVNGGTLGVQVGGSGWTTAQVDSLLGNATKTSGALGIDTTNGDVTQWATFTTSNLGSLGITKLGNNTLTLNATNTYTGATTVSAGTLLISAGNINSSSGVAVAGGATLINNSTPCTASLALTENSTLSGTGSFAPTSMTLTANLTDGFATIALGNLLTRAHNLELTLTGVTSGTYTLFSGTVNGTFATMTIGGIAITSGGAGDFSGVVGGYSYAFTNSTSQMLIAAYPEPSTWALLAIGLGLLVIVRRRHSADTYTANSGSTTDPTDAI